MDGRQPPPSSLPSSPFSSPSPPPLPASSPFSSPSPPPLPASSPFSSPSPPPLPASSPFSSSSPPLPPCTHFGAVEPSGQSVDACAYAARASSGTQLAGSRAQLAPSTRADAPRPNQIRAVVRIALLLLPPPCRRPPQLAA